jgi:hypothetical protein
MAIINNSTLISDSHHTCFKKIYILNIIKLSIAPTTVIILSVSPTKRRAMREREWNKL